MKKLINWCKKVVLQILILISLFIVSGYLVYRGYSPGISLQGWGVQSDENQQWGRVLQGIWDDKGGLGSLSLYPQSSQVSKLLLLSLINLFLNAGFGRFVYMHICLLAGVAGVYFFLKKVIFRNYKASAIPSFLGAVLYLFNFATLSAFSLSSDSAMILYAVFPPAMGFALLAIDKPNKRNLGGLLLTSFFSAPVAESLSMYASFFFVVFLCTVFWGLFRKKPKIKNIFIVLLMLFLFNIYWIFPQAYSVFNKKDSIENSKTNLLFSEEARLLGREYGDFANVIILKGPLFSFLKYDPEEQRFSHLFENWVSHFTLYKSLLVGYIFAFMAFVGALISVLNFKRNAIVATIVPVFFLVLFLMMNYMGPLDRLFKAMPEILDNPYGNFSIALALFVSVYASVFLHKIIDKLTKPLKLLVVLFVLFLGFFHFLPAFKDGIVENAIKVQVPQSYRLLANELARNSGRVLRLPFGTTYGWEYLDWGYVGPGTLTGLLNVSTLPSDMRNPFNETFQLEATRAIDEGRSDVFLEIMEKYRVKHIVFDSSALERFSPLKAKTKLILDEASNSGKLNLTKLLDNLVLYEIPGNFEEIWAPQLFAKIDTDSTYSSVDYTYKQFGNYVNYGSSVRLFENLDPRVLRYGYKEEEFGVLRSTLLADGSSLVLPDIFVREKITPVKVSAKITSKNIFLQFTLLHPKISIDSKEIDGSNQKYEIALPPLRNAGFLAIEDKLIDISHFAENIDVGIIYIPTNGKTTIRVYEKNAKVEKNYFTDILERGASYCAEPTKQLSFSKNPRGVSLPISKEPICMGKSLYFREKSLIRLSYTTPFGDSSFVCVNPQKESGCINVLPPVARPYWGSTHFSHELPLDVGAYWIALVGNDRQSKSSFNDVVLETFKEIYGKELNLRSQFYSFKQEKGIEIPKGEHEVEVVVAAPAILSENFATRRGYSKGVNCSLQGEGIVQKFTDGKSVTYVSFLGGDSCDVFEYPQLLNTQAHVLHIKGENKRGQSLILKVINNFTRGTEIVDLLPSGSFEKSYLVPFQDEGVGGYLVEFHNKSYRETPSENVIYDISFSPIPLKWLSEIAILGEGEISHNNKLIVDDFQKIQNIYIVSTSGMGVFSLSQSYDKGWIALDSELNLLKHLRLNNWSNAWEVSVDTQKIYVFYLPEIGGIIGLVISFSVVAIYTVLLIKPLIHKH